MIITSIDLMDGKVVQLKRGKEKIIERDDPIEIAKEFDRYGEIAVIDINGAMNRGDNLEIIKEILKVGECRVGGGIRTVAKAKELITLGAKKIIVGSKIFESDRINCSFLKELSHTIGKNSIIVAIDAINQEIVTEGWRHMTGLNVFDVVKELKDCCSEFLFTCVEREGTLGGTDMETIKKLVKSAGRITVAGGISSIDEITEITGMGASVQIGMAIYTKKIDLTEAFIESLDWEKVGLIPTIVQDYKGQVLTLAYSSKDSLKKAFETKKMWYFSRSRNRLWMKGETSGNTQELLRMRSDCDGDALLATVKQNGFACHKGSYSCFGEKKFTLHELYEVVKDRIENPRTGSYTATLDDKLLKEKILEESREVVEAKTGDEITWEVADLTYFLTVLLAKKGVEMDDVLSELYRRRKK